MKSRNRKRNSRPKQSPAGSRWKRWGSVLGTLLVALQVVQQLGQTTPTVVHLIAKASDSLNSDDRLRAKITAQNEATRVSIDAFLKTLPQREKGRPVTKGELESLRFKAAW